MFSSTLNSFNQDLNQITPNQYNNSILNNISIPLSNSLTNIEIDNKNEEYKPIKKRKDTLNVESDEDDIGSSSGPDFGSGNIDNEEDGDYKYISNFTDYEQLIKSIKLTFYNENNLSNLKYSEEENIDVEYLYNSSLEKYKNGNLDEQNHLVFILLIEKIIPYLKDNITGQNDISMVKKIFQTVVNSINLIEMNLSDSTKDAGFNERCIEFLCKFILGGEQDLYFSIKCHQLTKEEKEKHYKRVLLTYQDTFKRFPNRYPDILLFKAMTTQHTRKALLYFKNSYVVKKISDAFLRIKNHKNGSIYGFQRLFQNCSSLNKLNKNEINIEFATNWFRNIEFIKDFLSIKFKNKIQPLFNQNNKLYVYDEELLDFFEKCIVGFKAHYGKGVIKKKRSNNNTNINSIGNSNNNNNNNNNTNSNINSNINNNILNTHENINCIQFANNNNDNSIGIIPTINNNYNNSFFQNDSLYFNNSLDYNKDTNNMQYINNNNNNNNNFLINSNNIGTQDLNNSNQDVNNYSDYQFYNINNNINQYQILQQQHQHQQYYYQNNQFNNHTITNNNITQVEPINNNNYIFNQQQYYSEQETQNIQYQQHYNK